MLSLRGDPGDVEEFGSLSIWRESTTIQKEQMTRSPFAGDMKDPGECFFPSPRFSNECDGHIRICRQGQLIHHPSHGGGSSGNRFNAPAGAVFFSIATLSEAGVTGDGS
jgi:hypothetical protein